MRTIVGTRVQDEIIGLIDRAQRLVVLVTPFLRVSRELRLAIARAVARGVQVRLIARGPRDRPRDEELALFEELEADVLLVPRLHLKAYLSESEAISTSANLTRESVGASLESGFLFSRAEDPEGWNGVFEIWHRTEDDHARNNEEEPTAIGNLLADPRELADAGDLAAQEQHRYCIVCGGTASVEGDVVVCLRCWATAIAEERSDRPIPGAHCTACNGPWRGTDERPLCSPCYRRDQDRHDRRPARWLVQATSGSVELWWLRPKLDAEAVLDPARERVAAVRRRDALLGEGRWMTATLTSLAPQPVEVWKEAERGLGPETVDGVVVERVPARQMPPGPEHPTLGGVDVTHLRYTRHQARQHPSHWIAGDRLATWDTALPASKLPATGVPALWLWRVLLASRSTPLFGPILDAGRAHLLVELDLAGPAEERPKWLGVAGGLLRAMVSSLHSFPAAELSELLGADAPNTKAIVNTLSVEAPFGPGTLIRSRSGKLDQFSSRLDRVVAVNACTIVAASWSIRASIHLAKKAQIH